MQTNDVFQQLIEQTRKIINQAEKLQQNDLKYLTWKENPESWSILECLEHLNRYGDFYLPEIEHAIQKSNSKPSLEFKPGLLGGYFAKSMLPKEKLNKMKTFKDKNPIHSTLNKTVIQTFLDQQFKLLDLFSKAHNVNLNQVKIKTSISALLRLKLGDTFRFIVNHNIRHMRQIERVQQAVSQDTKTFI